MDHETAHLRRLLAERGVRDGVSAFDVFEALREDTYQPQMAPDYADDRNFPLPALLRMTEAERRSLGLPASRAQRFARTLRLPDPAVALPVEAGEDLNLADGAVGPARLANLVAATSTALARRVAFLTPPLRVRVWAVGCRNDDGLLSGGQKAQSQAALGPAIAKTIAAANKIFATANIELVFYPSADLEIKDDTALNQDFIINPLHPQLWQNPPLSTAGLDKLAQDPAHWTNAHRVALAKSRPDRLLLLFAEGTIFLKPQQNWRWCAKCQGLHYINRAPSVCPAGGAHEQSGSGSYAVALNATLFPGQSGWRWCKKCQGLFFGGHGSGACPAGGGHDGGDSGDYRLAFDQAQVPGQKGWRWCSKCQGLFFGGSNNGACPAGGQHDMSGSGSYTLIHNHPGPWLMTSPASFAYSGGDAAFVRLTATVGTSDADAHNYAPLLGHEVGHYFHLAHTHNEFDFQDGRGSRQARTIDDVRAQIIKYVTNPSQPRPLAKGDLVFDYDRDHGVLDTPPDTGNEIFHELHGAAADCDTTLSIPDIAVNFGATGSATYRLDPDRRNVMSYFKHCTALDFHYSPDQAQRMRNSLLKGNRRPLVAVQLGDAKIPGEFVSAVWNPGSHGQVYVSAHSFDDFRKKYDEMHGAGMRLHAQQAFVRGGALLFDGIWNPGNHDEHVVWGWKVEDFKVRAGEMFSQNMRLVHLESYVAPDKQVLVNAIWHPGTHGQQWVQAWKRDDFLQQVATLAGQGYRLAHMNSWTQPDGQERHDGIWNPGTHSQHYIIGWKPEDFRAKYDELWQADHRLLLLDAHVVNKQIVYDAVWNPSDAPQFVVWGNTREQVRAYYDEMWHQGMRLIAMNAVRL